MLTNSINDLKMHKTDQELQQYIMLSFHYQAEDIVEFLRGFAWSSEFKDISYIQWHNFLCFVVM